jgi:SAM-dependent methyltransferase
MLRKAATTHQHAALAFVQGDATMLPLAASNFDSVFMLGGIHHVRDRSTLFLEVARILKPGGHFYFREPVSDFVLWRAIRALVYRLSPALDHETERPLLYCETAPFLANAGLSLKTWKTVGFFGFCLFMNSDVLVFDRLFRYVLNTHAGLQVIGVAAKS